MGKSINVSWPGVDPEALKRRAAERGIREMGSPWSTSEYIRRAVEAYEQGSRKGKGLAARTGRVRPFGASAKIVDPDAPMHREDVEAPTAQSVSPTDRVDRMGRPALPDTFTDPACMGSDETTAAASGAEDSLGGAVCVRDVMREAEYGPRPFS